MRVRFWKMSGAGNDFVLLSGVPRGCSGRALARKLCDRREGIGADGLLALTRQASGNVALDYWNADGSAAFCGNGSRCAALWAAGHGWMGKKREFILNTRRGALGIRLTGAGRACVTMPTPSRARLKLSLSALGRRWIVHFVDTGVPHAVVFVSALEKIDVASVGRALRFHPAFGKDGANVNFVQRKNNKLNVRTYERGVEDETLACGTGVVASAYIGRALGMKADPIRVRVRGGASLAVSFKSGASLEGPGAVTFSGEVEI